MSPKLFAEEQSGVLFITSSCDFTPPTDSCVQMRSKIQDKYVLAVLCILFDKQLTVET